MAKMEFASLGSGSKGNGTIIRGGSTTLLIDCGFSRRDLQNRLNGRRLTIDQIDAILLTHEHGDHHRGVGAIVAKHGIPIYASRGTLDAVCDRQPILDDELDRLYAIEAGKPFRVKDITVYPIDVPHDVNEPTQYVCRYADAGVGVLTDCGSYTQNMVDHFGGLHGLLLETNHDVDMLWAGSYPPHLKARISGDRGHLSNRQSRQFADLIHHTNMQHLVLGHISEQNNELELIQREFDDLPSGTAITYASQTHGTEWLSVTTDGASL